MPQPAQPPSPSEHAELPAALAGRVEDLWQQSVLPSLSELVAIPAMSPSFDPDWANTGHLDAAIEHVQGWISQRSVPGTTTDVVRLDGRSPLLLVDIPASGAAADQPGTVLLYGHLDKQPPFTGWDKGLGPWNPVVRDGRLYGRGSVDDGYAGYAAITALEALHAEGGEHARCVLLLETGEESGSPDLPAYIEHLSDRLGEVSLVVCLDSGAGDYERLWLTTSLRGNLVCSLKVSVLESGQHSGMASGIVPSSFRIARRLLERIEDSATGEILLPELTAEIPQTRARETREAVESAPGALVSGMPTMQGMSLASSDEVELVLGGTWRAALSVTGADGLPPTAEAGNVLRPSTTLKLSLRTPPTTDPEAALAAVRAALTSDPPYGATVELLEADAAGGFDAPELAPWLSRALDASGDSVFGKPWRTMGVGGSIPFMGMLAETYPEAQFLVTGALGPGSNAHAANESLHLAFVSKVTAALGIVLQAHARR